MISFVVPAHNEEHFLRPTLQAIQRAASASAEPYEILVVNDASVDATARIAVEEGARVLDVSHRQIAATRNAGGRAASGDVLIFVDADTIVTRGVLSGVMGAIRAGAVGGAAIGIFDGHLPLYARGLAALWIHVARIGKLTTGCCLFCTRAAFEATGGFDAGLYVFEDVAFGQKLKRCGSITLLRDTVATSGRNLRKHSLRDAARMLAAVIRHRRAFFSSRDNLSYWYGHSAQSASSGARPERASGAAGTPDAAEGDDWRDPDR